MFHIYCLECDELHNFYHR
ncbi:hypothetical protein G6549_10005 [Bacillus sp. MM2020_1]|nr:hypothetical protein [Bacillus sp. MM2020_1]